MVKINPIIKQTPQVFGGIKPGEFSNWFVVPSSYDGFEQIWILEKTGKNEYVTRSILFEEANGVGYRENCSLNDVFTSLGQARRMIPGTAYPAFEEVNSCD